MTTGTRRSGGGHPCPHREVTLTPGAKRGVMSATLQGELGMILEWTARRLQKNKTDTSIGEVSVSLVAGRGFEPLTFRL